MESFLMNDACYRKMQTLRLLPKAPSRISVSDLHEELVGQGFDFDKRSLQRDLNALSNLFEISSDGNKDIPGWFWKRDAEKLELPEMEPAVALSFKMVKLFLDKFMPPSTMKDLTDYFNHAEKILTALSKNHLSTWSNKVELVSRNQPLLAPNVDNNVLNTIYSALLSETQFKAHYQPKNEEPRDYVINPLGLVAVDQILYLVCTLWEYQDVKQLAIHRFISVEQLETEINPNHDFCLQEYVGKGGFEYVIDDNDIDLVLIVSQGIATHLSESKLSENQIMTEETPSQFRIEATVKNTQQLRWWLLGFGSGVEILEPKELRVEFQGLIKEMSKIYL